MQKPIYIQIKEQIEQEIGLLKTDDIIESERELAKRFNASRMTVRKAVDILVEEGLLYRNKNLGTFVCDKSIVRKEAVDIILDDVDDNKILYFNVKYADKELSDIFNIPERDLVVRLAKSNIKDGITLSVDDIYYVKKYVKSTDINSITKLLDFSKIVKEGLVRQRFIPISVPVNYSNILKIKHGTPIIMVESLISTPEGIPIAFVRSYNNPYEKIIEIIT